MTLTTQVNQQMYSTAVVRHRFIATSIETFLSGHWIVLKISDFFSVIQTQDNTEYHLKTAAAESWMSVAEYLWNIMKTVNDKKYMVDKVDYEY